jgi:hypothetical protein
VPTCNATLDYREIQRFAAPHTFDRYDQFLLHQAMEGADSTYKRCASSGCNSGGWYDPATTSFIVCQSCQQRTCVDCDTSPYHSGQLCPNSPQGKKMRQEDDDATVALVERISKPCPNEKCGARIEKNEGCDHMTCMYLASPSRLQLLNTDTYLNFPRQEMPSRVLLVMLGAIRPN